MVRVPSCFWYNVFLFLWNHLVHAWRSCLLLASFLHSLLQYCCLLWVLVYGFPHSLHFAVGYSMLIFIKKKKKKKQCFVTKWLGKLYKRGVTSVFWWMTGCFLGKEGPMTYIWWGTTYEREHMCPGDAWNKNRLERRAEGRVWRPL